MSSLRKTHRGLILLVRFIPLYAKEMTLSNIRVAIDALRPDPRFAPGFVRVDLKGYGEMQRWGAACLISMTPGTLSLDLEGDLLLVHCLYLRDAEAATGELQSLIRSAFGEPTK